VDRDILIQYMQTNVQEKLTSGGNMEEEFRLEDYVVRGLVDFDDISYDAHADLLNWRDNSLSI
jgi:type III restriction enzyme